MRILHAPVDINSAASETSKAEKAMGHSSHVLVYDQYFGSSFDYNLNFLQKNKIINFKNSVLFFIKSLKKYDIFHFYYGKTLIPFPWYFGKKRIPPILLDLIILKIFKKKIFFTFHGSDVRRKRIFLKNYKDNMYEKVRIVDYLEDIYKLLRLEFICLFADKIFVTTPDLIFFIPSAEVTPQRINLKNWKIISQKKDFKEKVVISHIPSKSLVKGTKYIIKTIEELEKEGLPISFIFLEKIKHDQMKDIFENSDICIDQLLGGWHGMYSVEAMATKKPVICYINENLFYFAPWGREAPIVNANPKNLKEKLRWLTNNPEERKKIGEEGRKYVEKYHDSVKITKRLIKHYER